MFKSPLRRIYEKLACPYSVVDNSGNRKCAGYMDNSYTCTNPLAHLEYCGKYKEFEGITHE